MQRFEHQHSQLELNSFADWKPVQLPGNRRYVVDMCSGTLPVHRSYPGWTSFLTPSMTAGVDSTFAGFKSSVLTTEPWLRKIVSDKKNWKINQKRKRQKTF